MRNHGYRSMGFSPARVQSRRSNGRFTRNTPENTFGLHIDICPQCGAFNPYGLDEARPENCHRCGGALHAKSEVGHE